VTSLEGKDNLREQILIAVQEILQQRSKKTGIEEIYFTSFVMQ
jgi:flagellar basal body-associated protein FliL